MDVLVQGRHNSIANILELSLYCTDPSISEAYFTDKVHENTEFWVWISNDIDTKIWNAITHPCLNFKRSLFNTQR